MLDPYMENSNDQPQTHSPHYPNADRVEALRTLFPEALTEDGLIDADKLRAVLGKSADIPGAGPPF